MYISNVSQTEHVPAKKNSQPENINKTTDVNSSSSLIRTINMRNVSLNEINALVSSGAIELPEKIPFISPHIVEKYGAEGAANIKIDFLSQIETIIAFKKSVNEETKFEEMVLEKMKAIQGMEIPSIDTIA